MASSAAGGSSPSSCNSASRMMLSIVMPCSTVAASAAALELGPRNRVDNGCHFGFVERRSAPRCVPADEKFERDHRINVRAQHVAGEPRDGIVALAFVNTMVR